MAIIDVVVNVAVRIGFLVATTTLFVIILLAYLRARSRKMLLITIGFGVFFIHGLITMPEIFSPDYHHVLIGGDIFHLLFDMTGLIFILLGTLKE